jgi:hypothetical protein
MRVAVPAQSAATRFEANAAERARMRLAMGLQLAAHALSTTLCKKDNRQTWASYCSDPTQLGVRRAC